MKEMKVKLTFIDEVLGTSPANKDIQRDYVGSKAPDSKTLEEEIATLGCDEVVEKAMTIFHKLDDGTPFIKEYHIRGFFKEACGILRKVKNSASKSLKAYKKEIDGLIMVRALNEDGSISEDDIILPFENYGEIGRVERSLRTNTPQGERTAISISESIQKGSTLRFAVLMFVDEDEDVVREWLNYGKWKGLPQWRNASYGRFKWEEIE